MSRLVVDHGDNYSPLHLQCADLSALQLAEIYRLMHYSPEQISMITKVMPPNFLACRPGYHPLSWPTPLYPEIFIDPP